MNTEKDNQLKTYLDKVSQQSLAKFQSAQQQSIELAKRCETIDVVDENSLKILNQALSEAKELEKTIDKKREEIKNPFWEAGKLVDKLAKELSTPLTKAMAIGKEKLRQWNLSQDAKQKEAESKLAEEADGYYKFLEACKASVEESFSQCETINNFKALYISVDSNWPSNEKFGAHGDAAEKAKEAFLKRIDDQIKGVKSDPIEDGASPEKIVENVKAIANPVSTPIKSKTKKVWKFEIIDENNLAKQFLSADESKMRKWINSKKEEFSDQGITEKTAGGVRFYLDEEPVIQ